MTRSHLKKIIEVLSDGFFHTGTELGAKLGLTRAGIWKLIQQVQALGVLLESRTNKGYQIIDGLELLSLEALKRCLSSRAQALIQEIILFDEIPSTNDFLLKYPSIVPEKAVVCLAESQTAGRGRFGRKWVSPYASNLYLSLLWHFPLDAGQLAGLSLVIAVSIAKALSRYGIEEHIQLKWPNDVLWMNRKLAGSLIELRAEAYDTSQVVIGIGLNVNMPQALACEIENPWVDVRQIIQNKPERNQLAALILEEVLFALPVFQSQGLHAFKNTWERLNISSNKAISILTPSGVFHGVERGIDARGSILLESDQDKTLRSFSSGEVSLRVRYTQ